MATRVAEDPARLADPVALAAPIGLSAPLGVSAPVGLGAPVAGPIPVPVPFQDLALHNLPFASELEAVTSRVLGSGHYISSSWPSSSGEVLAFEEEAAQAFGIAHAIGVSSGTDALLAMLMAIGVGPGDEVVTTPFSFVASAEAIVRLGARPVFADVEPTTLTLDPRAAASALGQRTRAVLTVHLFGRAARSEHLRALCASRGIPLIEDAAQAIGVVDEAGRPTGAIGLGAALSFFPTKNLGGFGDGGMVLTNDLDLASSVRLLRAHGAIAKSHHREIGGNFRLDELQAALLRVKLPHLAAFTRARQRIAERYRRAWSGLPLGLPPDDAGCVWNQFVVLVPGGTRDSLADHLARHQIATAVYYPEPLHLQPCFAALGHARGDFPVAEQACAQVLALPIYPELTDAQIDAVIAAVRSFFLVGRPSD